MSKQFTLGKEERLKSQKQTELVFSEGKKFTLAPFRVYYLSIKDQLNVLQFGVGVSTKNFKKAVDRNRIKRLAREAYRLQKKILEKKLIEANSYLTVFFIYTGKELPEYIDMNGKICKVLNKLCEVVSLKD